jgi:hypothetical protein
MRKGSPTGVPCHRCCVEVSAHPFLVVFPSGPTPLWVLFPHTPPSPIPSTSTSPPVSLLWKVRSRPPSPRTFMGDSTRPIEIGYTCLRERFRGDIRCSPLESATQVVPFTSPQSFFQRRTPQTATGKCIPRRFVRTVDLRRC